MADIFTAEKRSDIMSRIKPFKNLSTEMAIVALFRRHRIKGWRRHAKFPGKPDFIFSYQKVAVFVDGDFWHGNPKKYKPPQTNPDFWSAKVAYNRKHDRQVNRALRAKGWTVVRIWESDLKKRPVVCLARICRALALKGA